MAAAYDNASQEVTERTVESNFKTFRSYLERNIKALGFIPYYDLFSEEHLMRIGQLNSSDPAEATREALRIIENLDERGKNMHLMNALEEAGYTKLVSVLKGYIVPVHGHHRKMIRLSIRHMYMRLKPSNVLPHLFAREVISGDDFEKISNIERNQSRGDAAMQLTLILPDKIKDWYRLFLESLVDGDHKDLAELIDPERTKKIIAKKEGMEESNWPSMISLQPRHEVEREMAQTDEDSGEPVSVNNLDAPNNEETFVALGSLEEMQNENSEIIEQYSISKKIEEISITEQLETSYQQKSFPQTKTKDILKMNSFESLKYDETSVKSIACPRSPESNISDVKQAFKEETNPKLLYERDPPDGSEIRQDLPYQLGNDNKQPKMEKIMKEKDLSASIQESKMDNTGHSLIYANHKIRILQLNKTDPPEATREALNITENLDEPGIYMHLIHALEDAEYPKLVSVLKGYFVLVDDYHRKNIRLSTRNIFTLLKPTNVLPHLLAKKVISQNDAETIAKTEMNESDGTAALDLMFILPNKLKHWYRLFLESLVEGNHQDLAELIDPELTKRIIAKKEGKEDIHCDSMLSLQPRDKVEREIAQTDEDSGKPVSVNNLDAPNQEERFLTLGSLAEITELDEQHSINENVIKFSISDTGEQFETNHQQESFSEPKTKDIPRMNSLQSLKYDAHSMELVACPRSPESNISDVNQSFKEETNLKLLCERDTPDGSEIRQDTSFRLGYDNRQPKLGKVMKDKDLSASIQESKADNIRNNSSYASRDRAENSKYVVEAEKGKGMAEKEELNMIREIRMRKANHIINSPKIFREEPNEFELRCFKCNEFICMSSDVKKIQNAHHVCVDESLKDRVNYVRGTSNYIDDQLEVVGKLICNECGDDLGNLIKHKGLEFPELKIEKYLIVDMNERQDSCKAWKTAPFDAQPLTTEDFRAILQKRKDDGYMLIQFHTPLFIKP